METNNHDERESIRRTSEGYKVLLGQTEPMMKEMKETGRLSMDKADALLNHLVELDNESDEAVLFESIQLARYGADYYQYHMVNVALLNRMIGRLLEIRWTPLDRLAKIGLVFDLGMVQLPERINDGKARLSEFDKVRVRQHPAAAVRLLQAAGEDDPVMLAAVLHHHERYGGDGYPQGLAGQDIPLEARILSVSDSFDAALARKAYRQTKSPFDVLAEFAQNTDGALDPDITQKLVAHVAQLLVGRRVVLSDNSVGKVVQVDPDNLAFPVVAVVGRRVQTTPELRPLSLSSFVPLR